MNVSVESVSNLERRLTITIPAEDFAGNLKRKLQEIGRHARLPGFRPGKIPARVIDKRFGGQARQEVLGDLVNNSYGKAIQQEDLRPAGEPKIEPQELKEGEDWQYVATVEIMPEFELAALDGLSAERPQAEITDADVDEMLETLRKQRTEYPAVERAAQQGDRVKVNYHGEVDGETFQGSDAEGRDLMLGEAQLPEPVGAAFDTAVTGLAAGAEFSFEVDFPDDHFDEQLQGKTARYTGTLLEVNEPQLPEVDEAFAEALGVEDGGVDALRVELRENMQRELDGKISERLRKSIQDALLAANDVELPKIMVARQVDRLRGQMAQRFGVPPEQANNLPAEMFEDEAGRNVALGLIFGRLIDQQGLKADAGKVNERLAEIAGGYENPQEVIRMYRGNAEFMQNIEAVVLEEELLEWLEGQVAITDVPMSFQEVMRPPQPEDDEEPEAETAEAEAAPA